MIVVLTATKRVNVAGLGVAAQAVRTHIERPNGEWTGSREWYRCAKAGHVLQDGKHVATVRYNGTVEVLATELCA